MLIRVRYSTGKIKEVQPRKLQKLIEKRKIVQFLRSNGWVTVGYDPIRTVSRSQYPGPERRT